MARKKKEPEQNKVTIRDPETETIVDEEVPLADAPKTGDVSGMLIAVIAIVAVVVGLIQRTNKKFSTEYKLNTN